MRAPIDRARGLVRAVAEGQGQRAVGGHAGQLSEAGSHAQEDARGRGAERRGEVVGARPRGVDEGPALAHEHDAQRRASLGTARLQRQVEEGDVDGRGLAGRGRQVERVRPAFAARQPGGEAALPSEWSRPLHRREEVVEVRRVEAIIHAGLHRRPVRRRRELRRDGRGVVKAGARVHDRPYRSTLSNIRGKSWRTN
ncbi:MAG: hypothetical protein U1F43_10905 [Myxococcota bacterium]